MGRIVLTVLLFLLWLYLLHVTRKAKLHAWHFIIGALGAFTILMIAAVPYITEPLARSVAAAAGLFGKLTGWYEPYFRYGMIFIETGKESLSMLIDFECSGVIELIAFECLLAFFDVYTRNEKVIIGLGGFALIMILNALRITLICVIVHFCGALSFGIAHTFIARIFFYVFTVLLYFFVFTRPQVIRIRIGNFSYGNAQKTH